MASKDIFERLTADHNEHRRLIEAISATTGASDERKALFETFKIDATAHAAAEEETFYATIMTESDLREDARHSVSEHKELSELFIELSDMDMASSGWLNKFNKLKEEYLHHIEEEETEKFPKAKKELDSATAVRLKDEFNARKPEEIDRAEDGTDEEEQRKEMAEGE